MTKDELIQRYKQVVDSLNWVVKLVDVGINLQTKNEEHMILGALYIRIRNGYNASNLLFNNNLYLESATIIRSVVEAFIVFNAYLTNPQKVRKDLELAFNKNRMDFKRNSLNYDELKESAKNCDFNDLESKKLSIISLASMSEMNKEVYELAYKLLCDDVHINLFSVQMLFDYKDGLATGFKGNMDINDFELHYFHLLGLVHSTLETLNEKFDLQTEDLLNLVKRSLVELNSTI